MTTSSPVAAPPPLDLWDVAKELSVTPKGVDTSTRQSLRRARRERRRLGILLALSLVAGSTMLYALIAWPSREHPVMGSVYFMTFAAALAATLFAGTRLLSAQAFRKLSSFGRRIDPWLWWSFALGAYLAVVISLLASSTAIVIDLTSTTSTAGSKTVAFSAALCGVLCAIAASATTAPLLSISERPRLYQAHGAQLCWTIVLIVLIISVTPSLLWLTEPLDEGVRWVIISVAIPIATGFVATLFAWHRNALAGLERARRELLSAVSNAIAALTDPEDAPGLTLALRHLESAVRTSPFRSQSPAAPPLPASWEVGEIVALLLWAIRERDFPDSIQSRTFHGADIAAAFERVDAEQRDAVLAAAPMFLRRLSDRLYLGAAGAGTAGP